MATARRDRISDELRAWAAQTAGRPAKKAEPEAERPVLLPPPPKPARKPRAPRRKLQRASPPLQLVALPEVTDEPVELPAVAEPAEETDTVERVGWSLGALLLVFWGLQLWTGSTAIG